MGPFSLEEALREFEKKFKDKSGLSWDDRSKEPKPNKYTFLEKNYESDDEGDAGAIKQEDEDDDEKTEKAKSELPIQTQRLMELIFNQNHFNSVLEQIGYNADKLPLGKLGKSTLKKGFEHLKELASLIKHPSLAQTKYGVSQPEASTPQFLAEGSARAGGRWSPTTIGPEPRDHLLFGG
jgi:poly [ADP-ribose] polymerase